MDVSFINPVLNSVLKVLAAMAQVKPAPGKPIVKKIDDAITGKHISGLITMSGKVGVGSLAFTFSESSILHIANKMLPHDVTNLDGMVIDLVGELANMVMGDAKSHFEVSGMPLQLSLPTIIIGHEYVIHHRTKSPIIQLPFSMPEGDFSIEVSFDDILDTSP